MPTPQDRRERLQSARDRTAEQIRKSREAYAGGQINAEQLSIIQTEAIENLLWECSAIVQNAKDEPVAGAVDPYLSAGYGACCAFLDQLSNE